MTTAPADRAAETEEASPRERLQQLAQHAGYGPDVLAAIADSALHPHAPPPGQKATAIQLRQIIRAVDVLVAAGRSATQVLTRLDAFRDSGGDWRLEFWRSELAQASDSHNTRASSSPNP